MAWIIFMSHWRSANGSASGAGFRPPARRVRPLPSARARSPLMRSMAKGSLGLEAGASPTARLWAAPCTARVRETSVTKSALAERTVATPTLRRSTPPVRRRP